MNRPALDSSANACVVILFLSVVKLPSLASLNLFFSVLLNLVFDPQHTLIAITRYVRVRLGMRCMLVYLAIKFDDQVLSLARAARTSFNS